MHTRLINDLLNIEISALGAELQSIKSTASKTEFLWQGNPEIWSGRAPILFPIVGALKNGRYQLDGKSYSLPRHGFARRSEFSSMDGDANSVSFELVSNESTRKVFPWDFVLQVDYRLVNNRIDIKYRVENTGSRSMQFTMGSHPAFNLTEPVDHYHIHFSHRENLQRFCLNDEGLLQDTGAPYPLDDQDIALTKFSFADDALIFKNINSNVISLCNKDVDIIRVYNGSAPHLGLWSKPAAPYVCIEPWFGYSDNTGSNGLWLEKPSMLILPPAGQFTHQWSIEMASVSG